MSERINEIKKALYKENPKADFLLVDKDGIHYEASLMTLGGEVIYFAIPFNDIGDAKFHLKMDAKHLIRWISKIDLGTI